MKVLVVVDMQNDFITGSLGTEEAKAIVEAVVSKITNWDGDIFTTQDTHGASYLNTQEGRNLPVPHCIEGTFGWEIEHTVQAALSAKSAMHDNVTYLLKFGFGSRALGESLSAIEMEEAIEEIHLVGLCTDICVIANAMILESFLPEVPIIVDARCCAGVTPESHKTALMAMEACQIKVINE